MWSNIYFCIDLLSFSIFFFKTKYIGQLSKLALNKVQTRTEQGPNSPWTRNTYKQRILR